MSRRSSLLSQQILKDGLQVDAREINDLIRQFPPSLAVNAARHSASFQANRGSNAGYISLDNRTPTQSRRPTSANCITSIRKVTSLAIQQPLSQQVKSKSFGSSLLAGSNGPGIRSLSQTRLQPIGRNTKISNNAQGVGKERMRRSSSMDSLSWLMTPSVTPASRNPKSPQSAFSIAGYETRNEPMTKNLKPPTSQDKKLLNTIFSKVYEFLEGHNYPNLRPVNSKHEVTILEYFNMCRFILQMMMGGNFMAGLKSDDLAAKLMETATAMKYPGILSKSILKSPNTPHQWPAALTFLAWLTLTVERALCPLNFQRPMTLLLDPEQHITDLARESSLRLFFQQISTGQVELEAELAWYQRNIMDTYGEGNITMEEINRILDEKHHQLEEKEMIPDPRKERLVSIQARYTAIRGLKNKETELTTFLNKYTDVDKLKCRTKSLKSAIRTTEGNLTSVAEVVANQDITKEEEKELINETELLRKQRETVEQVNYTMTQQIIKREQQLSNLNTRFYETCTRLNICDVFNDYLQKLELLRTLEDMERIPRNPFNPQELKGWLKTVSKIRKNTRNTLLELDRYLLQRLDMAEKKALEYEISEATIIQTTYEHQLEYETLDRHSEQMIKKLEFEIITILEEITICNQEIAEREDLKYSGEEEVERFRRKLSKIESKECLLAADLHVWEARAEKAGLEFADTEVYCNAELQKRISHYTARWNIMFFGAKAERCSTSAKDSNGTQ